MKKGIRFASALLILPFLFGCYTQTPKPMGYPYSTQQKMQSAYHWKVLAEDVANQIRESMKTGGYLNYPVYVQPACNAPKWPCDAHRETPFGEGFYDLLTTELLKTGMKISTQESGAFVVATKVQVLYHEDGRRTRTAAPGFVTGTAALATFWGWIIRDARDYGSASREALAIGGAAVTGAAIYDAVSGMFETLPHTEVLITTSIKDYNKYVMRKTDIYYINDLDYWHYQNPPPAQTIEIRGS